MGILNNNILTATGGISIDEVRQVLRGSSYDLGTLCLSSSINPRSRCRPNGSTLIALNGTASDSEDIARRDNYGYTVRTFSSVYDCLAFAFQHSNSMANFNNCFYTSRHTPTVYRLLDFVNYCHSIATSHWAYYFNSGASFSLKKDPNDNVDMNVSSVSPINVDALKSYLLPCSTIRYNNVAYNASSPDAYTVGKCKVVVMGCRVLDNSTNVIHDYFVKSLKGTIGGVTKDLTFDDLAEIPNAWYTSLANSTVRNSQYNVCFLAVTPGSAIDTSGQDLNSTQPIGQTFLVLPETMFSITVSKYTASQALGQISMTLNCYIYNNYFWARVTLTNPSQYAITSSIYSSMVLKVYCYGNQGTLDATRTFSSTEVGRNQSTIKTAQIATQDIGYNIANIKKVVAEYTITPQSGNSASISINVQRPSSGWPTTPPQ